ncbi:MAG: DUF2169 domain-containing protein [Saccharospirillaceae bacterium]|nr:DUF2169 domain-containing protein [Pseudomonadales bacterium]NRB81536.1 DUF2169 domain-containing protein [Saccharospirillaceae bacterium]
MSIEVVNPTLLQVAWIASKKDFPDNSLTLIVKGTFTLVPNDIAVQVESLMVTGDIFEGFNPNKGLIYESDFAYYKQGADLLLKGSCYTPDQKAMRQCEVSFAVGGNSRTLTVVGDRYALPSMMGESLSEPEPFNTMPISFENSYGGLDFEKNTVGKGLEANKEGIKWMSNVYDSSLGEKEPASFLPFNRAWSQRAKNLGTYDEKWQQDRWPWLPEDFDWVYFNAAHESLQVDGFLNGDESITCKNMHPQFSNFECHLPKVLPRCFVVEPDVDEEFKEIVLSLDTLYVDMDTQQLQLVWRGVTKVKTATFSELTHVYLQQESIEGPAASKDDHQSAFNVLITPVAEFDDIEDEVEPEEEVVIEDTQDTVIQDPFENAINQSKIQMLSAGFTALSIESIFNSSDPSAKLSEQIQAMDSSSVEADKIMNQSQEQMKQTLMDQGLSQAHIDILFPGKV